jgi:protein-tyrosine-phosphatase
VIAIPGSHSQARAPATTDGKAAVVAPLLHVVFLCTGNAARSVMGGAMLIDRAPELRVTTAGTHVIEGMPMSWRTRDSIAELGVKSEGHRSHQLTNNDVAAADVIVCLAAEHVAYMRRTHPEAAAKTTTLKRLARDLPTAPGATFTDRLRALHLDEVEPEHWEDVDDPAGGDFPVFQACAREIRDLVDELLPGLVTPASTPMGGP